MTIRAYTWEDEGAPVLPNISTQRLIDNLRIVLKACLVDGYGDKPGAGWTLGHDLPDGFSLGNGAGWLNVVNLSNQSVTVYAIEEITDFSTPEVEGVNKRSGELSDGYVSANRMRPQTAGFSGTHNGGLCWYVIADERTATFMFHGAGSASQYIVDPTSTYSSGWHFGEYITLNETPGFVALCGNKTTGSNGTASPCWAGGASVVLRNPFTGLVDQGIKPEIKALIGTHMTSNSISNQPTLPQLNRLNLARAGLIAGSFPETATLAYGTPVGTLRGVLYGIEVSAVFSGKVLETAFGIESPVPDDKFKRLPNILRPDHPGLFMAYPNSNDLGAFISLDPADWE